jgi:hypothetical protein
MAGAFVAEYWSNAVGNVTTHTLDINTQGPATANNLLVVVISVDSGGDSFTTPTGWTLMETGSGGSSGFATYYRVASGTSADDPVFVWTDPGNAQSQCYELSGLDSSTPFEASDKDAVTYDISNRTSINTGSATPLTANGMAVALLGVDQINLWNVTASIDSSYTNFQIRGVSIYAGSAIAIKAYTTTAAQSPTFSTTDTGGRGGAAIAVFKEPGGAAATGIRNPMGGPLQLRTPLGRAA